MLPTPHVLWSFALVAGLLTLTPGLDTALVLRAAISSGARRAWGAIVGIGSGVLVWGALGAVGVSALLAASRVAYDVLRIAGAAYLVWLGARLVWAAVRGTAEAAGTPDGDGGEARPAGPRRAFLAGWRQGFTTNLLNPKVGAFYVAILPQLVPDAAPHLAWGLALAGLHVAMGTAWLGLLVAVARAARTWLSRPVVTRWVDGVAGTVIAGFGLRLALAD